MVLISGGKKMHFDLGEGAQKDVGVVEFGCGVGGGDSEGAHAGGVCGGDAAGRVFYDEAGCGREA